MKVFVDTSAIIALLDARDPEHDAASTTFETLLDLRSLITHNYVSVETVALLQRRHGPAAVREFATAIEPTFDVVWVDQDLHRSALASLLGTGSRRDSLVDHVSFEFMRRRGVETAFTLDRDFRDEGFETLP